MSWLLLTACLRLPPPEPTDDSDETEAPSDTDAPVDTTPAEPTPIPCTRPNLETALASVGDWPIVAACGHFFFSSHNADRSLGLQLQLETRQRTFTAGETFTIDFAAPGLAVGALTLQEGTSLHPVCGYAADTGDDPTPSATWRATQGTATITVDGPSGRGDAAFVGHLDLRGVKVEYVGAIESACAVGDVSWPGLELGWYPGE